ncbi:MAG: hypothetical protein E6H06_15900 [Bacteroidetes bacterium]|nr:MAG: hypothetical protein E6H06_15900 [Bacteroidota bacterium]
MKDKEKLISESFAISEYIRYIAVYDHDGLSMKQRSELDNASSNESDKYEELLVNPVLIKLASQRGNIDCGGLEYFIIRYGNFFVLLFPCKNGHVNIGVEPDKNPLPFVEPINTLLRKYDLK